MAVDRYKLRRLGNAFNLVSDIPKTGPINSGFKYKNAYEMIQI